jgi:hypothetical protein
MVRCRVVCAELEPTKDIEEWIKYIGIEDDEGDIIELSQDEVIERMQKGDVFYIRSSDLKCEEEYELELEIKVDQGKYYVTAPPLRGYISGNPILDIGSCRHYKFELSSF